jgi:hypothetical protein
MAYHVQFEHFLQEQSPHFQIMDGILQAQACNKLNGLERKAQSINYINRMMKHTGFLWLWFFQMLSTNPSLLQLVKDLREYGIWILSSSAKKMKAFRVSLKTSV